MTIWRSRIASWIPKSIDTHSECVILIAFPPQKRLHERVSILRYIYVGYINHESPFYTTVAIPLLSLPPS